MKIGVPREIKPGEFRVSLTPGNAQTLTAEGHTVLVETNAGAGIDAPDTAYSAAGAQILQSAEEVFAAAELIVKVKEPQPEETARLGPKHTLFTYLHLAAIPEGAAALAESGATAIGYETVATAAGDLPLLAPMSEIAGRLAVQEGAHFLARPQGQRGLLISGAPGLPPAKVLVLGGGSVGQNAARVALGLGADVTVLQRSIAGLRAIDARWQGRVHTGPSDPQTMARLLPQTDLVICAALVAGARAPLLIRRTDLKTMAPGAVIVDVAIDQGGCCETSRPTTHEDPVYVEEGIVHYCVANMPGAVPLTSAHALSNATLPYLRRLARQGVENALADDPELAAGLNVQGGKIVHPAVKAALTENPPAAH